MRTGYKRDKDWGQEGIRTGDEGIRTGDKRNEDWRQEGIRTGQEGIRTGDKRELGLGTRGNKDWGEVTSLFLGMICLN